MGADFLDPSASGEIAPVSLPTGERHTLVVRRLVLDHRYHDDEAIQNATFVVRFGNGLEISGTLDANGQATLLGVPAQGEVRYGPDSRDYERADARENPDHRAELSDADCDELIAKYQP